MRILGSMFLERLDEVSFRPLRGSDEYHSLRIGTVTIHFTDKEIVKLREAALAIVYVTETAPPELEFAPEDAIPAGEDWPQEESELHPDKCDYCDLIATDKMQNIWGTWVSVCETHKEEFASRTAERQGDEAYDNQKDL